MQKYIISQYFSSWLNPSLALLCLGFSLFGSMAQAAEFRSILPSKAIAYDAPSAEAKKLYVMS